MGKASPSVRQPRRIDSERLTRVMGDHRRSRRAQYGFLPDQPAVEQLTEFCVVAPVVVKHEPFESRITVLPCPWPMSEQRYEIVEIVIGNGFADLVLSLEIAREPERHT